MVDVVRFIEKTGNFVLPKGRMLWPALFEKKMRKGETDPLKAKYQCSALIPASADISLLTKAVQDVLNENIPLAKQKLVKVHSPIKLTKDNPRLAEFADEYPWILGGNANNKPDVVTASGQSTLTEEDIDEIYQGRWCRISVRPYWFDVGTNKGPTLGLQNVQLAFDAAGDPGEAIAGGRVRGVSDFEGISEGLEDLE